MKTATLLEVMAEVGATARDRTDLTDNVEAMYKHAHRAWSSALNNDEFRTQLKGAAVRAILALHAHDQNGAP